MGLLQGSGGTAPHFGFVALHIHLPQQRSGAGFLQQLLEAGEWHLHSGFLAGEEEKGHGTVGGVAAGGEAHRSLRGPHGHEKGVHAAEQIVEAKDAQPPLEAGGDRFEGKRAGLGNATGQDCLGADVRTHIKEEISGPKRVEHEGHVGCFMEAAIETHDGARHAGS